MGGNHRGLGLSNSRPELWESEIGKEGLRSTVKPLKGVGPGSRIWDSRFAC